MFNSFSGSFLAGKRPGVVTDPTKLVNLQVWYNADVSNTTNFNVAPTNAADISQWKDRSGTGHNANQSGNASVKPAWYSGVQNNLGVLRFNGTSESLSINPIAFLNSLPGFTMMVVAKMTSATGVRPITCTDTDGMKIYFDGTNWNTKIAGGVGTSTVIGDTSKFHIFTLVFDGTQTGNANRSKFRYDGAEQILSYTGTVGTATSATSTTLYVGQDTASNFFQGDIGEMLMFTRTLNTSELLATEAYLKYHWAL